MAWHTSVGVVISVSQHVFLLCFFAGAAVALGVPGNRGEQASQYLGGVTIRRAVCSGVPSAYLFSLRVSSRPPPESDEDLRSGKAAV